MQQLYISSSEKGSFTGGILIISLKEDNKDILFIWISMGNEFISPVTNHIHKSLPLSLSHFFSSYLRTTCLSTYLSFFFYLLTCTLQPHCMEGFLALSVRNICKFLLCEKLILTVNTKPTASDHHSAVMEMFYKHTVFQDKRWLLSFSPSCMSNISLSLHCGPYRLGIWGKCSFSFSDKRKYHLPPDE